MILDRLQYFSEHFGNDQKRDQIWTLGACIYHQNTSTNTRQIMGTSMNKIFHIWESEMLKFWTVCVPNFPDFLRFEVLQFEKLKYGKSKSGNFERDK